MPRVTTLAARFDARANAVGFLRLFFALAVVASHTWRIGGYGEDPGRADNNLGLLAVEGFFALSGFLIVRSAMSSSGVGRFLWRRCLRIFPGFWVSLVVVALLAVLTAALTGTDAGNAWGFVVHNAGLQMRQTAIGTTLLHNPFPRNWNGPLYTLVFEFTCYLMVAALKALRLLRPSVLLVLTVVVWLMLQLALHGHLVRDDRQLRFTLCFLVGGLLYVAADRVRFDALTVGAAAAVAGLSYAFGGFATVGLPAFVLVVLAAASVLPFHRIGGRVDLSYGVYIYAWPIQQLLVVAGLTKIVGPAGYLLAVVVLLVPAAAVSWHVVEAPALRLKNLGRRPARELSASVA